MAEDNVREKIIAEVAKKAGISEMTVKLVIKGDKAVIPEISDHVISLLQEQDIHPDELKTDESEAQIHSNIVAVCAPYFSSEFMAQIMNAIERKVKNTGYKLFQFPTKGSPEFESQLIRYIINEIKPSGFITLSTRPEKALIEEFKEKNVPVVILDEIVDGFTTITYDNMQAGQIATEHLIKRGRKNIAIISGRRFIQGGYNALQRYNGFISALENNNMEFNKNNLVEVWRYSFEDGENAFKKLYEGSNRPDAVFCAAGDVCAMGFMKAAHDAGAKIPDDVAIVGFDDLDFSGFSTPALTTIKQPLTEMGSLAFDLVTDPKLYKENAFSHTAFNAKIVIRKST